MAVGGTGMMLGIVLRSSVRGGGGILCSLSKRSHTCRRKISSRLRFSFTSILIISSVSFSKSRVITCIDPSDPKVS